MQDNAVNDGLSIGHLHSLHLHIRRCLLFCFVPADSTLILYLPLKHLNTVHYLYISTT